MSWRTSVVVCILKHQFVLSLWLKTDPVSKALANWPRWIFFCFCLLSWRLEKTYFSSDFLEVWMGVIFVELWIELLNFSITDWSSDIQSAFPFSNTGFLKKFHLVLINLSAKAAPKNILYSFFLRNSLELLLTYSLPTSVSMRFGLQFDVLTNPRNASIIDRANLFFKGIDHPNLLKLSITSKIYLKPQLFLGPSSFMCNKSKDQISTIDFFIVFCFIVLFR